MSLASSIAVNAFIIVLLLVFFFWDLPENAVSRRIVRRFSGVIQYCGLDHDWSMFAPSPPKGNVVPEFELVYADGTSDTFYLDDFFGSPTARKGPKSTRYLKLMTGLIAPPDNALKKSFCRYLVQQRGRTRAAGEPADAPRRQVVEVKFTVLVQEIAPFGSEADPRLYRRRETSRHPVYAYRFPEPLVRTTGEQA